MSTICGVCRETYTDPRVAPCLHSFCKECVTKLVTERQGKFVCPDCQADFQMSVKDVENLSQNFSINNLMPILAIHSNASRKDLKCENCNNKKQAIARCAHCSVFLCSFCVKAHRRMNILKDHEILAFDAVQRAEPREMAKKMYCKQHKDEEMSFYCEDCCVMLCRDCTVLDHRGHEYVRVSKIMARERKVLQEAIQSTSQLIPTLNLVLRDTKEMADRVAERIEVTNGQVDSFIEQQITMLEIARDQLKEGVNAVGRTKQSLLESQLRRIDLQLRSTNNAVEFAKQALTHSSSAQVLLLKKHILTRLKYLSEQPVDRRPCQNDGLGLRITPGASIVQFIPQIAAIDSSTAVPRFSDLQLTGSVDSLVYTTFCAQTWEFTLTLRDHFNKQLVRGGNDVGAVIADFPSDLKEKHSVRISLGVTDNHDGSYSFSYKPPIPGQYTLDVKADGYRIKGSPFQWIVSQPLTESPEKPEELSKVSDIENIVMEGSCSFAWKVKIRETLDKDSLLDLKIGVFKKTEQKEEADNLAEESAGDETARNNLREVGKSTWYWSRGQIFTPDVQSGQQSHVHSCEPGDVFLLFLNPEEKLLTIVNETKAEIGEIPKVESPVSPFVSDVNLVTFHV